LACTCFCFSVASICSCFCSSMALSRLANQSVSQSSVELLSWADWLNLNGATDGLNWCNWSVDWSVEAIFRLKVHHYRPVQYQLHLVAANFWDISNTKVTFLST
jgi:hypothetical protein